MDAPTRVHLAEKCADCGTEEAYNILVDLLDTDDRSVIIAAVKGLGKIGRDTGATHLRYLMGKYMKDKEMYQEIVNALKLIGEKDE